MNFRKIVSSVMACIQIMFVAGCGGGGSGGSGTSGSTTKTATLVFSSFSTNAQIVGFDLTVYLPPEATIKTTASDPEAPLPSVVYLSGQFSGSTLDYENGVKYSSTSHKLTISYPSISSYALGEFLTIKCDVPVGYTPNSNFVNYSAHFFSARGGSLNSVHAKATFN